ncbi:hypothetical protein ACR76W_13575 [Enterococcus casseliflavus]|uniref:hypothetical protein n=1 Tax=Enterococcus casseliflavus TaxID=37734 RepID=UPI003DA5960D
METLEVKVILNNGNEVIKSIESLGYKNKEAAYFAFNQVIKDEKGFYLMEDGNGRLHHIPKDAVSDIVVSIYPELDGDDILF